MATESVITELGRCIWCGKNIDIAGGRRRLKRFCSGSRCRSAWHAQRRRLSIEALARMADDLIEQLDTLKRVWGLNAPGGQKSCHSGTESSTGGGD